MKIIVYCGSPDISLRANAGYSAHLRGMIDGFEALGHEVTPLIMGEPQGAPTNSVEPNPDAGFRALGRKLLPEPVWNAVRDGRDEAANRRGLRALDSLADTLQPDIIYERVTMMHRGAMDVARTYGATYVSEHNAPVAEREGFGRSSPLDPLARKRQVDVVENSDVAVYVSQVLRDEIEEGLTPAPSNGIVIPNCAPSHLLNGSPVGRGREAGSGDIASIIFVGSMIDWHRVDLLLDATKELHEAGYSVEVTIIGDGENRSYFQSESTRLGLDGTIDFTGMLAPEDVRRRLISSDIAVMPGTNLYGSPIKLLEYAAAGLPIIAPNAAPVREVFRPDVDALLIDPTVASLRQALTRLIDDPAARNALATSAYERVSTEFTWTNAAEQVLDAILRRQGLGGPKGSPAG